jgi:hypothetical protein
MHINTAITWLKVSSVEKTTLFILGSLHKAGREIWLSKKWLSDRVGCSRQWIYNVLESLDEKEFIICSEYSDGKFNIEVNEDFIIQEGAEVFGEHSRIRKRGVRLSKKP